jgi:hypothetical protein
MQLRCVTAGESGQAPIERSFAKVEVHVTSTTSRVSLIEFRSKMVEPPGISVWEYKITQDDAAGVTAITSAHGHYPGENDEFPTHIFSFNRGNGEFRLMDADALRNETVSAHGSCSESTP